MEPNLSVPLVLQHLYISLIPWLVVMILGGGFGYGFASLLRKWLEGRQSWLNSLSLLPWRSLVTWTAIVVIDSPLMVWKFGLGTPSGSITVGIALGMFIVPWVTYTLLRSWFPLNTPGKLLVIARVAAILSIALQVFLNTGMGYFIAQASYALDLPKMSLGYTVVGVMLFGVDLLFGMIQFAVFSWEASHKSFRSFNEA